MKYLIGGCLGAILGISYMVLEFSNINIQEIGNARKGKHKNGWGWERGNRRK
jgi:hypothetical protein